MNIPSIFPVGGFIHGRLTAYGDTLFTFDTWEFRTFGCQYRPHVCTDVFVVFFYRKSSALIFVLIYLSTGLLVWLGGREAWHIGASGLIYGLAAFLFLSGVLSSNVRLLTISLVVAFSMAACSGASFRSSPKYPGSRICGGALSGLALAVLFRKSVPSKPEELEEEDDEAEGNGWRR